MTMQTCYFTGMFRISKIPDLKHWILFNFLVALLMFLEKNEVIFSFSRIKPAQRWHVYIFPLLLTVPATYVYVCVFVFDLRPRGVGLGLYALNAKLAKLSLQLRWPSYQLTSCRKLAHISKLSEQIPKAFHQH